MSKLPVEGEQENWPVPESARVPYDLLRSWGELSQTLDTPMRSHRGGLGRLVVAAKRLIRTLVRPIVEPGFQQQAAWNSEVLRKIWELEQENRELRKRLDSLGVGADRQ